MQVMKKLPSLFLLLCLNTFSLYGQDLILDTYRGIKGYSIDQNFTATNEVAQWLDRVYSTGEATSTVNAFEANSRLLKAQDKEQVYVSQGLKLQLHPDRYAELMIEQPELLTFNIPIGEETLSLRLARVELSNQALKVMTGDDVPQPVPTGIFYRGYVAGNPQSVVALSLHPTYLRAVISDQNGNYILGKLDEKAADHYILYNDKQLKISTDFTSYTTPTEAEIAAFKKNLLTAVDNKSNGNTNCINIYIECDNRMYGTFRGIINTVAYVQDLFNEVATLYQNEGITLKLSEVKVWNFPDPYKDIDGTANILKAFKDYRPDFDGDLAHLLSTRLLGGGMAYLNGLCNKEASYALSAVQNTPNQFPIYSWDLYSVSHELGHNFGAIHTHSCGWGRNADEQIDDCGNKWLADQNQTPEGSACYNAERPILPSDGGTIMSYCHLIDGIGINISRGFGDDPRRVILSNYNNPSEGCKLGCKSQGASLPDLQCDGLGLLTFSASTNRVNLIGLRIKNTGSIIAPATSVGFYLSRDQSISADDIFVGTDQLTAIGVNRTSVASFSETLSNIPPGIYYFGVVVDYQNIVTETNESNNTCFWSSPRITIQSNGRFPNLSCGNMGRLSVTDNRIQIDGLTIVNDGNNSTGASKLGIYLSTDTDITTQDIFVGEQTVNSLEAGSSQRLSFGYNLPTVEAGNYYVGLISDYDNSITESDERDNNCYWTTPRVVVEEADVCASIPTVSCGRAISGSTLRQQNNFSQTDYNCYSGRAAYSGNDRIYELTIPTPKQISLTLSSLTTNLDMFVLKDCKTPNSCIALSTNAGIAQESITINNAVGTYYIVIDGIQPNIQGNFELTASCGNTDNTQPNLTLEGGTVSVIDGWLEINNLTIRNAGASTSNATTIDYYLSDDLVLDANDQLLQTSSIPALTTGSTSFGSLVIELEALNLSNGDYYAGVIVDRNNRVAESNESDNQLLWSDDAITIGSEDDRCANMPIINCERTTRGSTLGQQNNFTIADYDCYDGNSDYSGRDRIYQITVPPNSTLTVRLDNLTADLDLFLLDDCSERAECLSHSRNAGRRAEQVTENNANGVYYLVVDSKTADVQGGFELIASCTDNDTDKSNLTCLNRGDIQVQGTTLAINEATIQNTGGSPALSAEVNYYLSTDTDITTDDILIWTSLTPILAPDEISNEFVVLDLEDISISQGEYYVGFLIDKDDEIEEENESDNSCYWTNETVLVEEANCFCTDVTADFFCDDFERYNIGQLSRQSNCWTTWTGATGGREEGTIGASGSNQYLAMEQSGQDMVMQLGNRTSGRYELRFKIYLFNSDRAYYNILHQYQIGGSNTQWAQQVYFTGNGSGYLETGDADFFFQYRTNRWIDVYQQFDITNNTTTLFIDGQRVHQWPFTYTTRSINGLQRLSAFSFYAVDSRYRFFIDDIDFKRVGNLREDDLEARQFAAPSYTVQLFPNPTTGQLQLEWQSTAHSTLVEIFDLMGRKVWSRSYQPSVSGKQLDLQHLPNGMYQVNVRSGNRMETKTFVLRK